MNKLNPSESRNGLRPYVKEQLEAFRTAVDGFGRLSEADRASLRSDAEDYLRFRSEVDRFLSRHFSAVCSDKCYRSRLSACCSKDGIIVFFADVVVQLLASAPDRWEELPDLLAAAPGEGAKCVYLGPIGCRWRVRPIVCAMFLCDEARSRVLDTDARLRQRWEALELRRRSFTWPDRPVLFDRIESLYRRAGLRSSLMHCHESPGLLRVKRRAGLDAGAAG